MMQMLHPTYTLRLTVQDRAPAQSQVGGVFAYQAGRDGIVHPVRGAGLRWYADGSTGCDALLEAVRKALADAGIPGNVTLERFEHSS